MRRPDRLSSVTARRFLEGAIAYLIRSEWAADPSPRSKAQSVIRCLAVMLADIAAEYDLHPDLEAGLAAFGDGKEPVQDDETRRILLQMRTISPRDDAAH